MQMLRRGSKLLAKKLFSPMVRLFGERKKAEQSMNPVEEQEMRLAKYAEQLTSGNNFSVPGKKTGLKPRKRFSESIVLKNPVLVLKN